MHAAVGRVHGLLRIRQQLLTRGGEREPAAAADEQLGVELFFETTHQFGDRRLGDGQRIGGSGERAKAVRFDESPKLIERHTVQY